MSVLSVCTQMRCETDRHGQALIACPSVRPRLLSVWVLFALAFFVHGGYTWSQMLRVKPQRAFL